MFINCCWSSLKHESTYSTRHKHLSSCASKLQDCLATCEEEEEEDHDEGVTEIQHGGDNTVYAQLAEEVMNAVDEQIECCAAWGEEAAPPPVVVLKGEKYC